MKLFKGLLVQVDKLLDIKLKNQSAELKSIPAVILSTLDFEVIIDGFKIISGGNSDKDDIIYTKLSKEDQKELLDYLDGITWSDLDSVGWNRTKTVLIIVQLIVILVALGTCLYKLRESKTVKKCLEGKSKKKPTVSYIKNKKVFVQK